MTAISLSNDRVEVRCVVDLPKGFAAVDRLNPRLDYPFEIGGVLNATLPPGEVTPESGFPRVDLLPSTGVLLWIVAYDTEYEADPSRPPAFGSARVNGAPGLRARAEGPSRWDNILWAQTEVRISETKMCQLFTFAGKSASVAASSLDQLAPSIAFSG